MTVDWFRNETWSPDIEQAFQQKLRRARTQSPQYLYIQAITLAEKEPRVALKLVEQYFATNDQFHMAPVLSTQAKAYVALGLIDEAISSYRQAVAWERKQPQIKTRSNNELP